MSDQNDLISEGKTTNECIAIQEPLPDQKNVIPKEETTSDGGEVKEPISDNFSKHCEQT